MREEIRERQNSERSLDRLAAQRLLYGQAKSVEGLRLASVLLVAALLLVGLAVKAEPFSEGATMAVVLLWFIDQVALVPWVGRKREEAAAIQEDFDCCVLDIAWPNHLGVARPTGDRVRVLANRAQRAGVARKGLADWYRPEDIPLEPVAARLHCQRVNCHWDSRLRGEWICWVWFTVSALAVAGVVVGAAIGVTLLEVVLGVAAGIRLLAWLLLEQRAHSTAQKRMESLHGYLSRAGEMGGPTTVTDVSLVQAAIFEHRRTCPSVPDWYYWVRRRAYEGKPGG
ncbi:MAG: S-4TM family putative pore-forming effector [Chloroflexi bacterium]|nr:S-4TM family putative pore-forming effector [Chloroflexota bacterium]